MLRSSRRLCRDAHALAFPASTLTVELRLLILRHPLPLSSRYPLSLSRFVISRSLAFLVGILFAIVIV